MGKNLFDGVLAVMIAYAAENNHWHIIKLINDKFPGALSLQCNGKNLAHYAAGNGHNAIIEKLIDGGHSNLLTEKTKDNKTAVYFSIQYGHYYIAKRLLSFYKKSGELDSINLLLDHISEKKRKTKKMTILHITTKRNNITLSKVLLDAGADPMIKNTEGLPPYDYVIKNKNVTLAVYMCKQRLLLINQKVEENTILHLLVRNPKNIKEIITLLENGANPNIQDKNRLTPLAIAVWEGHLDIVKLLLSHKADPHIKTMTGFNCADIALIRGEFDIIKCFSEKYENQPSLFFTTIGTNTKYSNTVISKTLHKNKDSKKFNLSRQYLLIKFKALRHDLVFDKHILLTYLYDRKKKRSDAFLLLLLYHCLNHPLMTQECDKLSSHCSSISHSLTHLSNKELFQINEILFHSYFNGKKAYDPEKNPLAALSAILSDETEESIEISVQVKKIKICLLTGALEPKKVLGDLFNKGSERTFSKIGSFFGIDYKKDIHEALKALQEGTTHSFDNFSGH